MIEDMKRPITVLHTHTRVHTHASVYTPMHTPYVHTSLRPYMALKI